MYRLSDHVQIFGGSTLLREAIQSAFAAGLAGESVFDIANQLDTELVVVVTSKPDAWDLIESNATEQDRCVVAVIPDLDVDSFARAFRLGATGVIWEDTPASHLAKVAHAALHKDAVIPQIVLRTLIRPTRSRSSNIDAADSEILKELAGGRSQRDVADSLGYSRRTLQRRITNLCLELGAVNATHAVHVATGKGLL